MDGWERGNRRSRRVAIAAAILALLSAGATAGDNAPNVRLVHIVQRSAVARAVGGAARRLGHTECQTLLDEFADGSGRPLRASLEASGLGATEYLGSVLFYDASPRLCGTSALAVTTPGIRVVFVCGARFVRQMSSDSGHAEAAIIHEAFHSLGLGENPPSSDYITDRVLDRCWRR